MSGLNATLEALRYHRRGEHDPKDHLLDRRRLSAANRRDDDNQFALGFARTSLPSIFSNPALSAPRRRATDHRAERPFTVGPAAAPLGTPAVSNSFGMMLTPSAPMAPWKGEKWRRLIRNASSRPPRLRAGTQPPIFG
jgi:hypothetical protein